MFKETHETLSRIVWFALPFLIEGCVFGENKEYFETSASAGLSSANSGVLNNPTIANPVAPIDQNTLVCNPLDPKNQLDPTLGIKTSLYYVENVSPGSFPLNSCDAFLTQGTKANVEVYLSDLNIPPENFVAGFVTQGGSQLKKADGTDLNEWFSLRGETQIQLAPGQTEGDYELASLSDDGIQVELQKADGTWETVIDHQDLHSAEIDCSSHSVHLVPGSKIPMRFKYYQGPRVRIAMMLLWRKVDNSTAAEPECATIYHGDDYFFNGNTIPSIPMAPYDALVLRGWSPLQPANFLLTDGVNKCAMPH